MKSFYQFCLIKEQQFNNTNTNTINTKTNQPNQLNQQKTNQPNQLNQQKTNQPNQLNQQNKQLDINQLNSTIAQLKKALLPLGVKF